MKRAVSSMVLVLAALFAVSASYWLGREFGRREGGRSPQRPDTVRVTKWLHDTVTVESSRPSGSVQAWLPVAKPVTDCNALPDTTISKTETVAPDTAFSKMETPTPDTVLVEVPIEEKVYTGDNYRAIVRGYQPELTDIWVRETVSTIRVPVRRRWNVTAGPQVGIGITPDGWRPYAGLGVTFGYSF